MKKEPAFKVNEKEKKHALNVSIQEGSAASFSSGLGDTLVSPFALKLTDKPIHIGILSSLSGLASPLAQIYGSKLMRKYPRKGIVMFFVLLQAITWLPIATIGLLFWLGIIKSSLIYLLIIFYTLLASLGGLAHPAWFSWMGDLVPEKERGKYFAKRNLITGIIGLAATVLAAFFLKAITEDNKILGFALLFAISFLARFISYLRFHKQYSLHTISRRSYKTSISELRKENKTFRKFALYQLYFNLAVMVASPFFAMYMLSKPELGGLGFSDFTYLIVSISSTIFYLLFDPLAGKFSDKYGNLKLMYVANFLFVLTPLLWLAFDSPILLIIIPQLVAGAANAALVISYTNFTYDTLPEKKRGIGIAYANVLVGIGTFIGSLIGGLLLNYVQINFMNKFLAIFVLASLARLAVALYFMPQLKEAKISKRIHPLYTQHLHPFKTLHTELGSVVPYLEKRETEGLKIWQPR